MYNFTMSKKLAVSCCLTLIIFLGGCQTMSDRDRTITEGAGAGVIAGGLIGAIVGDSQGAAIGAALGGLLGGLAGNLVADRKEEYATLGDMIDGETTRVHQTAANTATYNNELTYEVAQLETRSQQLAERKRRGTGTLHEVSTTKETIATRTKAAEEKLEEVDSELGAAEELLADAVKRGADSDDLSGWRTEKVALETEKRRLEDSVEVLRASGARL